MNLKTFLRLCALSIIILASIGFIYVWQWQEIQQQLKQDAVKAKQLLEKSNKPTPEVVEVDNRPPPPGKSFEGGGHWQGDEWHDAPHTDAPTNNITQLLTPEEINQVAISPNAREQALKDHETIVMYYHNEQVYYDKYEKLREDNRKIHEELDNIYIPQDEAHKLSETEKIRYIDRLKLILKKLDLNQARRDSLKEEKPVPPVDAMRRYHEYGKLVRAK